jgi:hypothetical protein
MERESTILESNVLVSDDANPDDLQFLEEQVNEFNFATTWATVISFSRSVSLEQRQGSMVAFKRMRGRAENLRE